MTEEQEIGAHPFSEESEIQIKPVSGEQAVRPQPTLKGQDVRIQTDSKTQEIKFQTSNTLPFSEETEIMNKFRNSSASVECASILHCIDENCKTHFPTCN